MSTIFDNERFSDFYCPNCKRKINETVGRLKRGDYTCPGCGTKFETKELRRTLDKAEQDFLAAKREIERSLKINL